MNTSEAGSLARSLMNQHNLTHWVFEWDRAKKRAGCCNYTHKRISLSYYYVQHNDEADVRNTILHEIAHALAGAGNGHNHYWRQICRQIGARPERCCRSSVIMPKGQYKATCGNCQRVHSFHRRPTKSGYFCKPCGPRLGALTFYSNSGEVVSNERKPVYQW